MVLDVLSAFASVGRFAPYSRCGITCRRYASHAKRARQPTVASWLVQTKTATKMSQMKKQCAVRGWECPVCMHVLGDKVGLVPMVSVQCRPFAHMICMRCVGICDLSLGCPLCRTQTVFLPLPALVDEEAAEVAAAALATYQDAQRKAKAISAPRAVPTRRSASAAALTIGRRSRRARRRDERFERSDDESFESDANQDSCSSSDNASDEMIRTLDSLLESVNPRAQRPGPPRTSAPVRSSATRTTRAIRVPDPHFQGRPR